MGTASSWTRSAAFTRQGSFSQAGAAGRPVPPADAGIGREFDYDLLLMFVRNEAIAALSVPILAIVFAVTMLNWANPRQLLLWLATILISEGILLALTRQFKKEPRETVSLDQWRRKLTAAEFLYGVCWGAFAFTGFAHGNEAAYFFLFAALTSVTAIRMLLAASVMPVLHAGTIPVTAALCLRFLMSGEAFYWLMAIVAVGIHFYFVFLVKSLRRTALSMLDYRAEKDRLIDELKREKASSDEARAQAEAGSLAKSKFLAHMSHELRTPLNAIMGFAQLMKDEAFGPIGHDKYKSYAADIHASGDLLLNIINDILDLSRIEAGKYELTEQPVDLGVVAHECLNLLRLDAQAKNLRLMDTFKPDMPQVRADERALRQICINLLANAIKFTQEGGTVALITGMRPSGEAFLTVRDNGPGIPGHEIPSVMRAFGQGSLASKTQQKGTGLGLPIVAGLAELHGGRFELRSKVKAGTDATLVLPKSRVMPPRAAPAAQAQSEKAMPFRVLGAA